MEIITLPLSPPLEGGEIIRSLHPLWERGLILSPRPLGERVRVRGIFGSMTSQDPNAVFQQLVKARPVWYLSENLDHMKDWMELKKKVKGIEPK